ncbi:MAG: ADOP family duplicated permease [Gemmatimonadales bacterium]
MSASQAFRREFRRVFRLPLFRRTAAAGEEEFEFHLDMRASELISRGWEPDAARAEARRQFGDVTDAQTYCRRTDARREKRIMRSEYLAELLQDVAYAIRGLRKAPGFAVVAILTLALGIGANTAIFSVVRGILLRPLPFADPSRVVMVASSMNAGKPFPYASPANIEDWRTMNHSFSSFAAYSGHSAVVTGAGDPENLRGYDVSAGFFDLLGVSPVQGRLVFSPEEAVFGGTKAVLVRESLWRTRFGANPSLVGSTITLDNENYRVAGVVPNASAWPATAMIWFPLAFDPARLPKSRGAVYVSTIARLKPGMTYQAAALDMDAVSTRLERDYPDYNKGLRAQVIPLQEFITGSIRLPLLILLGGVAFVLLIACVNVANLLLVRGVAREGELAVRSALGAGRGRLVRQLVTESMVLALAGGAAGFLLAIAGTKLLVASAPQSIPLLSAIHVDGLVLGFTLVIATVTGAIFGLAPARRMVRPDIAKTLREGGRSGGRGRSHVARRALVVAEVALSVMLLAGAGLLIRSFNSLMSVDPGFRTENSISFAVSLPNAKYSRPEQQAAFMTSLMDRMHALPGVQSTGAGFGMPLTNFGFGFTFKITGHPPLSPNDEPDAQVRIATPGYFGTMGIRIVRGRGFTDADRAGGPKVLLLTEAAVKKFFPGEDPIGKHVTFGMGGPLGPLEGDIVGVVADVKGSSLAAATQPQFWAAYDQWPMSSMNVVLHTTRDPQAVVADARAAIKELDPDLAIDQVKTLDAVLAESVAQPRFYMVLLTAFALVAIALSAIGIYGVVAYLVGQRSRELGIRIALGATPSLVVRLVVREGVTMVAVGIGVGLAGALAVTRLMGALLFGVKSTDPVTYAAVTALLGVVALIASSVPASRAAHVDPAIAMRAD